MVRRRVEDEVLGYAIQGPGTSARPLLPPRSRSTSRSQRTKGLGTQLYELFAFKVMLHRVAIGGITIPNPASIA